ncbi:fungal-specific transcription factor domain-containing protein [Dipodascopsis uninucleata]
MVTSMETDFSSVVDSEPNRFSGSQYSRTEAARGWEETVTRHRKRVAMACTRCRTKKSRCDGARPVCSFCAEIGEECVYRQPASMTKMLPIAQETPGPTERRLEMIEERLCSIESSLKRHESIASVSPRISDRITRTRSSFNTNIEPSDGEAADVSVAQEDIGELRDPESTADAMGAISFADQKDSGFFGPSSNTAFIAYMSRAMAARREQVLSSNQDWSDPGIALINLSVSIPIDSRNHISSNSETVDKFSLPQESEMNSLIQQFFANTGMLFPFVHEVTFYKTYAEARANNFRGVRLSWLVLLNMVLASAVGSTTNGKIDVEQRTAASEVYYRRAHSLHTVASLRGVNIEVVQYLLLMVQYLQGSQRSVQTWALHGIAVKTALQLGLQSDIVSKDLSQIEREIRKRTWYGCVILDRTLSMTFGRPSAIPEFYVKLEIPSVIPEDFAPVPAPFKKFSEPSLSLAFFNATIELYRVMWRTIDSLYGQNLGCIQHDTAMEIFCSIVQRDQELTEWKTKLVKGLNFVTSSVYTDDRLGIARRLRTILSLRYNNIRLLIYRPILTKLLDYCSKSEPNDEFEFYKQVCPKSIEVCLESATNIISLVHSPREPKLALGAWWFSLYFTFNAALTVFSASLIHFKIPSAVPSASDLTSNIRNNMDLAIDALQRLDIGNVMVERCYKYLAMLRDIGLINEMSAGVQSNSGTETTLSYVSSNKSNNAIRSVPSSHSAQYQSSRYSPLGMELGEFMKDGDLDFLNDMFDPNSYL